MICKTVRIHDFEDRTRQCYSEGVVYMRSNGGATLHIRVLRRVFNGSPVPGAAGARVVAWAPMVELLADSAAV